MKLSGTSTLSMDDLVDYAKKQRSAASGIANRKPLPDHSPMAASDAQERQYYRARANAFDDILRFAEGRRD